MEVWVGKMWEVENSGPESNTEFSIWIVTGEAHIIDHIHIMLKGVMNDEDKEHAYVLHIEMATFCIVEHVKTVMFRVEWSPLLGLK